MDTQNFDINKLNVYTIKNVPEVEAFFNHLTFERNLNFIPGITFDHYINQSTGQPLFTTEECKFYDKWMKDSFAVCKKENIDINDICPVNAEQVQAQVSNAKKLPVYNIALSATQYLFEDFESIEVHPVEDLGGGFVEQCDEVDADYFTVYVHKKSGGLEAIADCENKDDAERLEELITRIITQITEPYKDLLTRSVYAFNAIPNKNLGKEDTYKIASDIGKLLNA